MLNSNTNIIKRLKKMDVTFDKKVIHLPNNALSTHEDVQILLTRGFSIQPNMFDKFEETYSSNTQMTKGIILEYLNSTRIQIDVERAQKFLLTRGNKTFRFLKDNLTEKGKVKWERDFSECQPYDLEL